MKPRLIYSLFYTNPNQVLVSMAMVVLFFAPRGLRASEIVWATKASTL